MSDTIYTYYKVPLSKENAIALGYISSTWQSKLDYNLQLEGRVCVRIERPPLNTPGTQEYKVSYSFCSPSDNFNRKLARTISSGRPKILFRSDKPLKVNEISLMAIELLSNACKGPKSVLTDTGVNVKIPNWISISVGSNHNKAGVFIPEYKSR